MPEIVLDIQRAIELHESGRGDKLHGGFHSNVLKAMVYGANDGIITTFAVVVGVAGAGLSPSIILILGVANLVADGLAMGIGDYLGERSEQRYMHYQYQIEQWEIKNIARHEAIELTEYFRARGVSESDTKSVTEIIQKYPKLWAEIGFIDEMGAAPSTDKNIWHTGVATFGAFVGAGFLPLLPYFLHTMGLSFPLRYEFLFSVIATAGALFVIGSARTRMTKGTWWKNGLEMLSIGAIAAVAAYISGAIIKKLI